MRPQMIPLTVQIMDDGRWRIETPMTRGWAAVVRTPVELAAGVREAFKEVTIAAYAAQHGEKYDLSGMTERVKNDPRTALTAAAGTPPTHRPPRMSGRPPRHDPASWSKADDGRWRAPSGRLFREDSQVVQNVLRLRTEAGLPNS